LATPQGVDGWIQLPGYGRPVRGPVVAVTEITIDQLQSLDESFDLGFPDVSPEALRAWRRQQISSYKKALACCVASTWAKDSIVRDYSIRDTKVEVVGWGANLDVRPPMSRDWFVPRFLFVGRQWERKNGEAVLRAFGRLRKECPTALLDVVGGHPALSQEGVQFHGPVAPDDPTARAHLVSLFQQATCFVMPSLVEPFGIVYVEAGRAGIPSIATRNGGASDAVGEGGVLVDPHDDSAILEAMRQLSDPRTARRLGALALSHSSLFTWPKVAERIVRAFGFAMDDRVERAEFPSR
jgi:glycosyltransferase involved in cell wall biosynthesis